MCTHGVAVLCHAMPGRDVACPAPSHHRLLPRSKSCLAMFPNPTVPTLRNPTSDSRHTFHPLPTHIPSLSLCTFHPFVVTTLALSNSSHVFFHGLRETGLFTHGSDTLSSKIISMCTPDVAMPCLCYAWLGCAMPLRHRTIGSSRVRNLVLPCFPTPQLPPYAIPHLTPDPLSILSLLAFHPFVVSTPAFSNSSHVSFHGVRAKMFSTHVTT